MARPHRRRPKRRRRHQGRHVLAKTIGADEMAGPAEAWKCDCGAEVLHWMESVEVHSTLMCSVGGVRVGEIVQTVPPEESAVRKPYDVVAYECGNQEHGNQTHRHHIALVETAHGVVTTDHPRHQDAIDWLRAQGLDDEDLYVDDLHDEDLDHEQPS